MSELHEPLAETAENRNSKPTILRRVLDDCPVRGVTPAGVAAVPDQQCWERVDLGRTADSADPLIDM